MTFIPLLAMVRKDLQLFFSDRRSVIVSFVVPIAIGSFFGAVFSGGGGKATLESAFLTLTGRSLRD